MTNLFKLLYKSKSGTRLGIIQTPHGIIETPQFIPVGTQGCVKSLTKEDLKSLNVPIFFVNTYHMLVRPGIEVIKKFKGLNNFINWDGPLITDSGGFQVFSLARKPALVKINKDGVQFRSHWDGKLFNLNAEKSIEIQHILAPDIIIAFDDCTPYPVTIKQAKLSLERTHCWAQESLKTHQKLKSNIAIYGSIQGSVYEDLRKESAKFISGLDFDGFAIGGVSVGESKEEMKKVLHWTVPFLPDSKPRHLLGVGEIDDIFTLVENGIDTFDCVMPTRLARMGFLLVKNKKKLLDISKKIFSSDKKPIEESCKCYTCENYSRAYLHHLFKVRELLVYRLATIHNIYFINNLMKKIRQAIKDDKLTELKSEYCEI